MAEINRLQIWFSWCDKKAREGEKEKEERKTSWRQTLKLGGVKLALIIRVRLAFVKG